MHRAVNYGITQIGFRLDKLHEVYSPDVWEILEQGNNANMNRIEIAPGQKGAVPANYLIARPQ